MLNAPKEDQPSTAKQDEELPEFPAWVHIAWVYVGGDMQALTYILSQSLPYVLMAMSMRAEQIEREKREAAMRQASR